MSTYGTRDDFLIPSACLNSTVSGLVSRTVLNDDLIGPTDYHGAKFYAEHASRDVSAIFLDTVSARFEAVRNEVDRQVEAVVRAIALAHGGEARCQAVGGGTRFELVWPGAC